VEDDETIDDYLNDLAKDGTWGGQIDIQAMCMRYNFNIIVH
jgi:hypothetical protein